MSVIIDASVTIALAHVQERTPAVLNVFKDVVTNGAWAPPLWRIEVANAFQMQVRKRRYGAAERDNLLRDIDTLPIDLDADSDVYLHSLTVGLADRHDLTVYDAVYLELAMRKRLPLATLDMQLRRAAAREGVPLLGL